MSDWQTHTSRSVYENPWIRVREDHVTRPDGTDGIYGVVEVKHPAVFVVPVTDDGQVVMIRQYRYTVGHTSLEVPAGGTDGQDPLTAARRELLEETGYVAESWQELGKTYSLNGVSDAPGTIFLAQDLWPSPDGGHGQAEEGISEVIALPWSDVVERVRVGEIHDGETTSALLYAAMALGRLAR